MDRFRWLGLGPEEFWHTDPENVWAWGFIIGGLIGHGPGSDGVGLGIPKKPSKFTATVLTRCQAGNDAFGGGL